MAIALIIVWGLTALTGLLLWLAPSGQRAGKQLLLFDLTKSEWGDIHFWVAVAVLIVTLVHIIIDWKGIGSHATRTPAELDMIFIPNFNNFEGSNLIKENESKFVSLLLIFGQINLLKIISDKLNFKSLKEIKAYEDRFFY